MINSRATLFLLAFPIGLMGTVQGLFALLSLVVFHDHQEVAFFEPASAMLVVAMLLLMSSRNTKTPKVGFRDALLFATLTWVICGVLGGVPIILTTGVSFTDGVFESISALTTTGATILSGLDDMPKSFLMYRQFLQWLGGLGVVIFVVAVLPMLNVGGMKLLKAETPGPFKDDKLSPRIANTAHYLWLVYLSLTLLCMVCYYLAGMNVYDAVAHSFTTVSTGGFSTHDASMGYFNSHLILAVANLFMLLGAISFAVHFRVGSARNPLLYWENEETRTFVILVMILSLVIAMSLLETGHYQNPLLALSDATFHLISFMTSTGFAAASFTEWPMAVAMLLIIAGYLGGCAGSTAGGNKIVRNILSLKLIMLEMRRLIHPNGVFMVKYQGKSVEPTILSATVAFMALVALSSLVFTMALMMTGLDVWSAFTAVAACLNVLGPAFGKLGSNFQPVSDVGIWLLSAAMILGRLEYFTVLALLMPAFWRR
ncbi:TrkH family potassium uptake protein [Pseudomaricurvus sp.]|uniref:TrkH family potassium uptake protein n=1 Tax=Pseudomaricurvus sp. TaxID=2004510 RepID=UPI003F6C935F